MLIKRFPFQKLNEFNNYLIRTVVIDFSRSELARKRVFKRFVVLLFD